MILLSTFPWPMAGMGLVGSSVMATVELGDSKKDMGRNLEWRDLFL